MTTEQMIQHCNSEYAKLRSNGSVTTGNVSLVNHDGLNYNNFAAAFQCNQEQKRMSGNKPIVVCGSEVKEAKDMDDAQAIAESLAHKSGADAYILKPVKKVAPKRDVVTTDL